MLMRYSAERLLYRLDLANSRMKNFCDIWALSRDVGLTGSAIRRGSPGHLDFSSSTIRPATVLPSATLLPHLSRVVFVLRS